MGLGGMLGATKIGKTGKRHGFLKRVTVNRSGKTGKRFRRKFFFGKCRETTSVFESGNCKQVGKERETSWGKIFEIFFRERPGNDIDS